MNRSEGKSEYTGNIKKLAKINRSANVLRQYVEECAELILTIQKYKRSLNENNFTGNELIRIAEEIADTEVCKEQLFCCFKEMREVVDKEKELKVERQLKRFENKNKKEQNKWKINQ